MNRNLVDTLTIVCPSCRIAHPGAVTAHRMTLEAFLRIENTEIREGFLQCTNPQCMRSHPIVDGVAVIVRDLQLHMALHGADILRRRDLSPSMENFLVGNLNESMPQIVADRFASTYLRSHFGEFASGLPQLPVEEVLPLTSSLRQEVCRLLDAHMEEGYTHAVDLGCAVGRFVHELALRFEFAIGMDIRFHAVRSAREIAHSGHFELPERVEGFTFRRHPVALPELPPENMEFLVADTMDPPFLTESFDCVLCLGLLDVVSTPVMVLGQADALLKPGGLLVISSPYNWTTSVTAERNWLGPSGSCPWQNQESPVVLKRLLSGQDEQFLTHLNYEVLEELHGVPWPLTDHSRQCLVHMCHLLAARKSSQSSVARPVF